MLQNSLMIAQVRVYLYVYVCIEISWQSEINHQKMLIHIITFVKYFFSRSRYTIFFLFRRGKEFLTNSYFPSCTRIASPFLFSLLSLSISLISYANDFDRVEHQWLYSLVLIEKKMRERN